MKNIILSLCFLLSLSAGAQVAFPKETSFRGNPVLETGEKPEQLVRMVNAVRRNHGLAPLPYQKDDQPLANLKAKELIADFRADTLSSYAEVVYRGTYDEVLALISDPSDESNAQFREDVMSMSIAMLRDDDMYYVILRLF